MRKSVSRRGAQVSPFILAVAISIVLALLTVSCGHGKSAGTDGKVGAPLAAPGQGRASTAPTLASILAEIDTYPAPKGVDAVRFAMLKAELKKQLIARKADKLPSAAPSGAWDAVTDLDVTTDTGGTQATLTWTEKLWGDYDNSGEVSIGDLVPLAAYYGMLADPPPVGPWNLVQGDHDQGIGITDVVPIAQNYGAHMQGYRVYRGQQVGSYIIWDTTWRPNPNTNNPDWSVDRPYPPPTSTRPSYTYIDNIRTLPDKTNVRYKVVAYGDGAEGVASGPAVMPPPGTYYIGGTISWWGSGIPNVLIQLAPGGLSGLSLTNGAYRVYGATNGTYTVTPTLQHWTFTPPSIQITVSGANVTNANFPAAPGLADSAWPKFRGNARNTGLSAHVGPQTNAVKWMSDMGSPVSCSPAVGPAGTVFVGSYDGLFRALDPATGKSKWGVLYGDSIDSSPAVTYAGDVYIAEYGGLIHGHRGQSVNEEWTSTPGGFISSSPAIGLDGTIYIGSMNGKVYALNPGDGSTKWTRATGWTVNSSPAIGADGTVYVGSGDGYTYALYPIDGSVKWAADTGPVNESPAVGSDGTVYVGTLGNQVYALNPGNGSVRWSRSVAGWVTASPAIGPDGTVYFCVTVPLSVNNYVYALNRTDGSIAWQQPMPSGLGSSPAVGSDGKIYLGCGTGIYALSPTDGSVVWTYDTGSAVDSSPAIAADGALYIGSDNGKVYAFGS